MQLRGKVAIVTGAARGIGKGIALKLAAEGTHLALVDLLAPGEASLGYQLSDASLLKQTGRAGVTAYCASKFAVIGFTQALAEEVGPLNITVNAVCPGFLRTAMWTEVINKQLTKAWNIEHTDRVERRAAPS